MGLTLTGCAAAAGESTPPHIVVPDAPAPVVEAVPEPARIDVDKIGAHSTLIPLGLQRDGTAQVPDVYHPDQAGWFCNRPDPQARCRAVNPGERGPSVVYGHVNGAGHPGVFAHLADLQPGDLVHVGLVDGRTLTFKVAKVERKPKATYTAADTAEVFGDVDHPALRLVTCGGPWVAGRYGYADNIIAFADLET